MKKLLLFLLVVCLVVLNACSNSTTTDNAATEVSSAAVEHVGHIQNKNDKPKKITPSGYEYVYHIQNVGPKPKGTNVLTYHYKVFKNDTSLVLSSYKNGRASILPLPALADLPKPISPLAEGLLLMTIGDSISLWHKLDSLSSRAHPKYSPNDVIRYDFKMVDIQTREESDAVRAAAKLKAEAKDEEVKKATKDLIIAYKAGGLEADLVTTASGLKHIIHEAGTGKQASAGKFVKIDYSGFLNDGRRFDSTFRKRNPYDFLLGREKVIKGLDEGIALLKEGAKATFFIPYELGYGEVGSLPIIPRKSELIFYVELLEVR